MATSEAEQPKLETPAEILQSIQELGSRSGRIWQILERTAAHHEEAARWRKATERQMAESERRMTRLDHRFSSQWGSLMEALIEGDLIRLLRERDVNVHTVMRNYRTQAMGREFELDLIARNQEVAVIVEVKSTLRVNDVRRFENTLSNIQQVVPEYAGDRVLGAVAYLKAHEDSPVYAEKRGLYVIRAVGSSSSIVNARDFRPRDFGPKRSP